MISTNNPIKKLNAPVEKFNTDTILNYYIRFIKMNIVYFLVGVKNFYAGINKIDK